MALNEFLENPRLIRQCLHCKLKLLKPVKLKMIIFDGQSDVNTFDGKWNYS